MFSAEAGREPEKRNGADGAEVPSNPAPLDAAPVDSTLNQPLQISAADKILTRLATGRSDIPKELYEEAGPDLASRFTFTITKYNDGDGEKFMAIITPRGLEQDESKKSYNAVKFLCPDAKYVDDCVLGLWQFPEKLNTADKIAAHLTKLGFVIDMENQDPALLKRSLTTAAAPGVTDFKDTVIDNARKIAGGAGDALGDGLKIAGRFFRGALRKFDGAIDDIAKEPGKEPSAGDRAFEVASVLFPILKPTQEFADARVKYREGLAKGDEKILQEARRACFKACTGLGIDVFTLGSASTSTRVGSFLAKAARGFNFLRSVGEAANLGGDPLEVATDKALQEPWVVQAMDYLLSSKAPDEPRSEDGGSN